VAAPSCCSPPSGLKSMPSCCSPPSGLKGMSLQELRTEDHRIYEEVSRMSLAGAFWYADQSCAMRCISVAAGKTEKEIERFSVFDDPSIYFEKQLSVLRGLLKRIDALEQEAKDLSKEINARERSVALENSPPSLKGMSLQELRTEHDRVQKEILWKSEFVFRWYKYQTVAINRLATAMGEKKEGFSKREDPSIVLKKQLCALRRFVKQTDALERERMEVSSEINARERVVAPEKSVR
jgi:hypothetical protein